MRFGLFSDIHSNFHALKAVLADMDQRGVDQRICLGDITLKGPLPKECVDLVRDLGCPVVLGNTDGCYRPNFPPSSYTPRTQSQVEVIADFERHQAALTLVDQTWLHTFPLTYTQQIDGMRLDFFHATPQSNYVLLWPWSGSDELAKQRLSPQTQVSVFGHNHRPFVRYAHGLTVINSGSVGGPFDGDPRPSYVILDVGKGASSAQIIRVPYDAEAAIRAAKDIGMRGWELFAYTARTGEFPG